MRTIAVGAALAVGAVFQAAAVTDPTISSAQATLSNLGFQVVDLDKTDGIKASFTLQMDEPYIGASLNKVALGSEYTQFGGTVFSSSTGTATYSTGDLSASKLNKGLSVSLAAQASDVQPALSYLQSIPQPAIKSYDTSFNYQGDLGVKPYDFYKYRWTLAPNTSVVIKGNVLLQSHVDASGLEGSALLTDPAGANWVLGLTSTAGFVFNLIPDSATPYLSVSNNLTDGFGTSSYQEIGRDGVRTSQFSTDTLSQSFELVFTNFGSETITGVADVSVNVSTKLTGYVQGTTGPIPEPGTWALMAMGLGLMTWRVRASRG